MATIGLAGSACWAVREDGSQEPAYGPTVTDGELHWFCDSFQGSSHGEHEETVENVVLDSDSFGNLCLRCTSAGQRLAFYDVMTMEPEFVQMVAAKLKVAPSRDAIEDEVLRRCGPN